MEEGREVGREGDREEEGKNGRGEEGVEGRRKGRREVRQGDTELGVRKDGVLARKNYQIASLHMVISGEGRREGERGCM